MTVEEFLRKDNSYLTVPHSTTNFRSLAFWRKADSNNREHSFAGSQGNQREAYENGVRIGWNHGIQEMERTKFFPHNSFLSDQEYADFTSLLVAFGYSFVYITHNPYESLSPEGKGIPYHVGLNIMRNQEAINAGVTVSEEVKQKVYKLLKENSNPIIWKNYE